MPSPPFQQAVQDSIAKVNDEIAVVEDLTFQEHWWMFERTIWVIFALILLCTFVGLLGRGPLATRYLSDQYMKVQYERIARTGTPNILEVKFNPSAIQNGRIHLFVADSLVKELGSQRVIPAPLETSVGNDGLTYTFAATTTPAAVKFMLQPDGPGVFPLTVGVAGQPALHANVVVLP